MTTMIIFRRIVCIASLLVVVVVAESFGPQACYTGQLDGFCGVASVSESRGRSKDHALLQLKHAVLRDTVNTAHCCDECYGTHFCSPGSGNCYQSKAKPYYENCTTPSGNELNVMSYNTEYVDYNNRVNGYGEKIIEVGAASVGAQECQDKYALARTSGYEVVPDTDFQNPIFYNPNVVSIVEGSSGWMEIPRDNYSPRTITWAKLKFGNTDYLHFNTHLPHNHGEASSRNTHARIAQMLLRKREELGAGKLPTVVTGDMNTFASKDASEGSFESNLVAAGFVKSYQARGNPGHGGLDQIFHTAEHFKLVGGSDRGTGGSDHPAIVAGLALKERGDSDSEPPLPTPVPTPATTATSCCTTCIGMPFCSPDSGNCYQSKAKAYYESCDSSSQSPTPVPTSATTEASCCTMCVGKPFCSPGSGNCYESKSKSYYKSCDSSEGNDACSKVWNNEACTGQFGNQECHTCGERISWLRDAEHMEEGLARAKIAAEHISICGGCAPEGEDFKIQSEGYTTVWEDDFGYEGEPDSSKWKKVVQGDGGGNNEKQYYVDHGQAYVSGGTLKIKAQKKDHHGQPYKSAKLVSKASWTYGKVSVRARINQGKARGTWPAIWMMPTDTSDGWPKCGELDIMEHVGYDQGKFHGTVHTGAYNHMKSTQKGGSLKEDVDAWVTWTMEWRNDAVLFAADNVVYNIFRKESDDPEKWPFDKEFYLILNMAVGGNWGAIKGIDSNAFRGDGQILEIDWVKVERKSSSLIGNITKHVF